MNEKTCEILRKPVASHSRRGPSGSYSYHKGSDVIRRLNEAFGHCWSSEKLESEVVEDQVLMLVSLTVYMDGDTITHQGYGSADIKRRNNDKKIVSIGNDYKSAFTNALKKAAEQFGIGLGDEDEENVSPTKTYTPPPAAQSRPPMQSAPQSYSPPPQSAAPTSRPPMSTSSSRPPMARPEPIKSRAPMQARPSGMGGGIRATAAAAVNNAVSEPEPAPGVPSAAPINPEPMAKPEVKSDVISSVQEHALVRLAAMKGLTEAEIVMGALPESGKVSFKELLRTEASEVIKYANVQPQGAANV